MKETGNTKLTNRDRFKNSQIAHDRFPPCGDMPYLITRLRDAGFNVEGKILDAGCGQGRFGRYMAQLAGVKEVLGIDESRDAIAVAGARIPGRAAHMIKFQLSEVTEFLNKKRNKKRYEIVSAFNLLEYVEDPQDVLSRLIAATKVNGFLVGSVHVGDVPAHSTNHWKTAESFIEKFPELTLVDMKTLDRDCAVFIHQKLPRKRNKTEEKN